MKCAVVARGVETNGTWMRMYLKINGKTHYLWRAVDQDGNVLDIRVAEPTRTAKAAKRFFAPRFSKGYKTFRA